MRRAWPALLALAACGDAVRQAVRVEVGAPAPPYTAMTLTGDSVSLASQQGSVVILNVWATWCPPCRAEIPELMALQKAYRHRGLALIGVSVDAEGAHADVRDFMRDLQMDFTVWLDPADRISTQFLLLGVPTTFVIDRGGVLRWRKTGPVRADDSTLVQTIERALST